MKEVARRARSTSPLGDYSAPLGIIAQLTRIEPMARVLVHLREWLPDLKDVTGRGIEVGGGERRRWLRGAGRGLNLLEGM